MISFNTKKPNLSISLKGTGKAEFDIPRQKLEVLDNLSNDKDYVVEIKEFRPKRSLNANAYCFLLIGKLADKLKITPKEVYRKSIKEIGDNYDIYCMQNKAVEKFRTTWENNGLGWQTEILDSKVDGCTNVVAYYGSSTYDTKQMSRLIENIVEECKLQGIDVRTPEELALLVQDWKGGD